MGWRDQELSRAAVHRGGGGAEGAPVPAALSHWIRKEAEEAGSHGACEGPRPGQSGLRSVQRRPSPSGSGEGRAEALRLGLVIGDCW